MYSNSNQVFDTSSNRVCFQKIKAALPRAAHSWKDYGEDDGAISAYVAFSSSLILMASRYR